MSSVNEHTKADSPRNPFEDLVAPQVRGLSPYVPGKPIEELRREKNLEQIVKLASNENPLGPPPAAVKALRESARHLHRYPDGYGFELKSALARHWEVGVDNIILGNGSSEVIEMGVRLLVQPGQNVVLASPSFSIYELTVIAQGGVVRYVPLCGYRVDLKNVLRSVDEDTALVILGNPNNPTGDAFRVSEWEGFFAALPRRVGLLLDEAYAEYAEVGDMPVGREYLDEERPFFVARTFSKAYGLALLRIGYGLAPSRLVDYMNRLRLPFNANGAAQAAAVAALGDVEYVRCSRELNRRGLERLYSFFRRLQIEFIPSQANFVLARIPNAEAVTKALLDHGVIVRWTATFGMPEWVRITVGNEPELEMFERAYLEVRKHLAKT